MKALVHTAPYTMELQEWPTPTYGPDDLLVRVKACAICGSDIKGYSGKTGRRQPPIIMGHEASGVVEAVGSAVTGFAVGDRVTFDSTVSCGHCYYCNTGHPNLCDNREVIGVSEGHYRRHGAMAEYVVVPARIAVHLPDAVSFTQAALVETTSIGVHAANRTPIKLNDRVVIVGAGAVGLVTLQAVRLKGAGKIIVTDLAPSRLQMALCLGADAVVPADMPDQLGALLAETGPRGADATFEAVGLPATVNTAQSITRKGGSLTLIGNVTPRVEIDLQSLINRELTVYGVCATNDEFADCVDLIATGRLTVDPFIAECVRLEDGPAVFDRLYHETGAGLRTVFVFD